MSIKVLYSECLLNENSLIFELEDSFEMLGNSLNITPKKDTNYTTLSKMYKKGYRLIQAVKIDGLKFLLFLEK